MSPLLQDFYNEMYRIISDDCYRPEWFDCELGLCTNFEVFYCIAWPTELSVFEQRVLDSELGEQFEKAGLNSDIPFNSNLDEYFSEKYKYTNPKRLAWIRQHTNIGEK